MKGPPAVTMRAYRQLLSGGKILWDAVVHGKKVRYPLACPVVQQSPCRSSARGSEVKRGQSRSDLVMTGLTEKVPVPLMTSALIHANDELCLRQVAIVLWIAAMTSVAIYSGERTTLGGLAE